MISYFFYLVTLLENLVFLYVKSYFNFFPFLFTLEYFYFIFLVSIFFGSFKFIFYYYYVFLIFRFFRFFFETKGLKKIPFLLSFCLVIGHFPGFEQPLTLWMENDTDYQQLVQTLINTLRADPDLMHVSTVSIIYIVKTWITLMGHTIAIICCDFGLSFEEAIKLPLELDFQNDLVVVLKKILLSEESMNKIYALHKEYLAEKFRWDRPRAYLYFRDLYERFNDFLRGL